MNINIKPRNGTPEPTTPWEEQDAHDKLAELVTTEEIPEFVPDDPKIIPPPPTPRKITRSDLRAQQKPSVQDGNFDVEEKIREVAIKLVDLMTDTAVRCWVQDGTFIATKVFERKGKQFKQTTSIRFAGVSVKTVELIREKRR